jgi:hypothetical protein
VQYAQVIRAPGQIEDTAVFFMRAGDVIFYPPVALSSDLGGVTDADKRIATNAGVS